MSNLTAIREQAINIAKQACEEDRKENYQQALQLYEKAIKLFMHVIRYDTNPKLVETLRGKTSEYLDRAEKIRDFLKGPTEEEKKKPVASGGDNGGDKKSEEEKDENAKLKDGLSSAIVTEKPNVKWDDVAGLEGAKSSLQEAVILPTKFPQLFVGKRRPWKGILLYGPPGTGKSYLAKACATEAEGTFFSVSSSDLVSKWMGESERLVRSLFEMARANKPAIIFIDEIDSLCGSRSDGENDSSRRIKTEFLVQMQGVGHDDQGILVLGATNIPWGLDSAIRRRFERRIYIPLPDERARAYMFKLHTGDTPNAVTDEEWNDLGRRAEGYSGSDISVVVRDALMEPVRKCQSATHFKQVTEDGKQLWEPCPPSAPGAKEMKLIDIAGDQLKVPVIEYGDFVKVLETSRPSVSQDDLKEHEQFTKDFGQEG